MSENVALERGFITLEDGDFEKALQFFDNALNENPHEAEAYWGNLLCEMFCTNNDDLISLGIDISSNSNYKNAVKFSEGEQKKKYTAIAEDIRKSNQKKYCELLVAKRYREAFTRKLNMSGKKATAPEKLVELYYITDGLAKLMTSSKKLEKLIEEFKANDEYKDVVTSTEELEYIDEKLDTYLKQVESYIHVQNLAKEEKRQKEEEERKKKAKAKAEADKKKKAEQEKREAERKAREKKEKATKIVLIIVAVCVAVVIVFGLVRYFTVTAPTKKYDTAIAYMNDGKYHEAQELFIKLDDFKDSQQKVTEVEDKRFEKQMKAIKNAEKGDIVSYGYSPKIYNESGAVDKETFELQWLIVDKQDDKVLLIAKSWLYEAVYYDGFWSMTYPTWESSSVRERLNGSDFDYMFTGKTAEHILDTETGENTTDKLFLLTYSQIIKYYGIGENDKIVDTSILLDENSSETGEDRWFIIGYENDLENLEDWGALVYSDGSVGSREPGDSSPIRPAVWVSIAE